MPAEIVSFMLNKREVTVVAQPLTTVQTVLRDQLGLLATKSGCQQGGCGSCTVLVDGQPMLSCLLPAQDIEGRAVTTLEGLTTTAAELDPLQAAFYEHFAVQCGYCSPGMIMTAKALLERNPRPTKAEIAEAIAGNVCRCTGYQPIIEAIAAAAVVEEG
jgi:aerobic carbon-monoxide dehydrogenase small subunit